MSDRELAQLFRDLGKDLDRRQRARVQQLRGIERNLFEVLVKRIIDTLDQGDGVVKSRSGSATINRMVDEAFDAVYRSDVRVFMNESLRDLTSLLNGSAAYYQGLTAEDKRMNAARFKAIKTKVNSRMRQRLGIGTDGKPSKDGYLEKLIRNDSTRTEVREALFKGVNAGKPVGKLTREIEVLVKGTREVPGVMERYFRGYVFDTYQAFDRTIGTEYASRLKLDTFFYQGGLIETSRDFCKKRDGKVFTEDEAKQWVNDPTLPKTSKERSSGVVTDYNPIADMGRWNCRHRVRYISRRLAEQERPDLSN